MLIKASKKKQFIVKWRNDDMLLKERTEKVKRVFLTTHRRCL